MNTRKRIIKDRIAYLNETIAYNEAEGEHTFSMCKCGRQGSRSGDCSLCCKEEIKKLKEELKCI